MKRRKEVVGRGMKESSKAIVFITFLRAFPGPCRYLLELMSGKQLGSAWAKGGVGEDADCLVRRQGGWQSSEVGGRS